jgi:cellulose synthase operon protein C
LALAHCSELMIQAYEAPNEGAAKTWFETARKWYQKAQAAEPKNISIARDLAEFFLRARQFPEAEAQLDAILKSDAGARSDEIRAWARRTKALILASSADPQRVRGALALLEPSGPDAKGQTALQDPDDLRALAQVLNAQRTPQDRLRAIAILRSLVTKSIAKPDDQFLLAQLYENSGNWDQGREEYRALNAKTTNARDLETWNRRPQYLVQFARSLLGHRQAGDEQTLSEVQDLVDELKQIQPDALTALELQVELFRARNQLDKAVVLIRDFSEKSNLSPQALKPLAQLAEGVDSLTLAGQLYKKLADSENSASAKRPLITFLAKHDRLKEALDIYEPLIANERDMDLLANTCIDVVLSSPKYDAVQFDRVDGWLEKALKAAEAQNRISTSSTLLCTLGNIREHQKRYPDAENFYKRAVDKGGNPIAYNNLAWLMALQHDGALKDALAYIERAIALKGPLVDFLDTRGVIYLLLDQPENAVNDLEAAVKGVPTPAKLFHLAQAYLQNKEQAKAKQALQNAKTKGLPSGLHPLEMQAYKKLLDDLEPL